MASFDEIEQVLAEAARLLNQAACGIRDIQLAPQDNIRRIGDALVQIADIRRQIYDQRPDLMPEHLRKR